MEKWEYTTIKVELEGIMGGILNSEDFSNELNILGEKGWELVSCFSTNAAQVMVGRLLRFLNGERVYKVAS